MLRVAFAQPADELRLHHEVLLLAVGVLAAQLEQEFQLVAHAVVVRAEDSDEVRPEDAGIAVPPQQDHRVGRFLEVRMDPAFERLSRLRVVVVDKGHRLHRVVRDERVVKERAQVVLAVDARRVEVEMQRTSNMSIL